MTQKFILIMGAGRCGSSSLVSYLNSKPDFNIFGENCGAIYSILESIHRFKITQHHSKNHKQPSHKTPINKYQNKTYCGYEWYNNQLKIDTTILSLEQIIKNFFDNNHSRFIGYKDIRWGGEYLSESIKILENIFHDIKYVHLTRNIDVQADSMKRARFTHSDMKQAIQDTNDRISYFLKQKPKSQQIQKNITTDHNFLEEIYQFLIA